MLDSDSTRVPQRRTFLHSSIILLTKANVLVENLSILILFLEISILLHSKATVLVASFSFLTLFHAYQYSTADFRCCSLISLLID